MLKNLDMENKILETFLHNYKLKFNELQKATSIRSNKLAYHLNKLQEEGVIEKDNENYQLNKIHESKIPFISKHQSPLPVLLILIKNKDKVFLIKRNKRPYKEKLGLPGGRILLNETISEATKRIMKDKFDIKVNLDKVNSVSLEHVKNNEEKTIHSFVLFLVTAKTNQELEMTNPKEVKDKIITSDYWLIKNNSEKEIKIDYLVSEE